MTAYSLINSWLNFSWIAINIKLYPSSKLPWMEIQFQALALLPKQFWNFRKSVYWTEEVRESTLMPSYKVRYFIEQGQSLNLNATENVHMSKHLIYITAIIKHLGISGSRISTNSVYYHKASSFCSGFSS